MRPAGGRRADDGLLPAFRRGVKLHARVGAGAGAPWRALAVAMSFMNQVAALQEFFKPPLDAPLPLQVAMMNEAMGIVWAWWRAPTATGAKRWTARW